MKRTVKMHCKQGAVECLRKLRGMSEAGARKFIRDTVVWRVRSAGWEDVGQVRDAEVSVEFNFGATLRPFTTTLEYYCRARYYSVEHHCQFKWDGAKACVFQPILQGTKLMLKAAHIRDARERSFPEGWRAQDVMEFVYSCIGAGGYNPACHAANCKKGLSDEIARLCKALDKPAAKKQAPAKKRAPASGGVAKTKGAAVKSK